MNQNLIKHIIGYYLILSGIAGVFSCLNYIAISWQYGKLIIPGLVFMLLFVLISFSGYLLIKYGKVSWLLICLQIIQFLGFSINGYKYQFCSGMALKIMYSKSSLSIMFEPIDVEFFIGKNIKDSFLYFNIIPIFILVMLILYLKKSNTKTFLKS